MPPEAALRATKFGLVADEVGWFVVNAREARWREWKGFGVYCDFEGKRRFPQLGINVSVLQPGDSLGLYHRENAQEDFLVVAGSCVLVIEDEERELGPWDFVHCPPGTAHMIVGSGAGASVVVAVGRRGIRPKGISYLVSPTAARFGVSVDEETSSPQDAYRARGRSARTPYRDGWLP